MTSSGRFSEREETLISLLEAAEDEIKSYGEEDPVDYNSENVLIGEMHAYESPGFEVVHDALQRNEDIEAVGLEFVYGSHEKVDAFNQGWIPAEEMAEFYRTCCDNYTGSGFEGDIDTVTEVFSILEQRDGDIIGLEFTPAGPRTPENFDGEEPYSEMRWSQMADIAVDSSQEYEAAAYLAGAEHVSSELGTVFSFPGYLGEVAKLPDRVIRAYNEDDISDHDIIQQAKSLTGKTLEEDDQLANRLTETEPVLALTPGQLGRSFDRSMESDTLEFFIENSGKLRQQVEDVQDSISDLSAIESSSGDGHSVSIK